MNKRSLIMQSTINTSVWKSSNFIWNHCFTTEIYKYDATLRNSCFCGLLLVFSLSIMYLPISSKNYKTLNSKKKKKSCTEIIITGLWTIKFWVPLCNIIYYLLNYSASIKIIIYIFNDLYPVYAGAILKKINWRVYLKMSLKWSTRIYNVELLLTRIIISYIYKLLLIISRNFYDWLGLKVLYF